MMDVSKPCVLIVDDEMFIRALIARRLDLKGYRVLQSSNTEEAYRTIQAEKPDVVVCDILMPGGDGVSFCRQLHVEGDKTPFLFMTMKGQSENVIEGLSSGADDYLIKPVDLNVLEARILTILRRRA